MENEVKEPAPKFNYITPEEYPEMEANSMLIHLSTVGLSMYLKDIYQDVNFPE